MMRTIRLITEPLNAGKVAKLTAMVAAFNDERKLHVEYLKSLEHLRLLDGREMLNLCNFLVKIGYASPVGLQSHSWKMALAEARNLIDRHWQAQLATIRTAVHENSTIEPDERHLLFYVLFRYHMIADILEEREPESVALKFKEIEPARRKTLLRWLRRRLKAMLRDNRLPVVQIERTTILDSSCYRVFQNRGRSYITVTGLEPGKRIMLPLRGDGSAIRGNIVMALKGDVAHFHTPRKILARPKVSAPKGRVGKTPATHRDAIAIDAGFTEVAVDDKGVVYGDGFGKLISAAAGYRNTKGIRRGKLQGVALRARVQGDEATARRIEAHNLGTKKQSVRLAKNQAGIEGKVNQALNLMLGVAGAAPAVVVHEDLSRAQFKFECGAARNRAVASWARGIFAQRLEFKAQVRGSHLLAVNPAYSSQLCPDCGFVDAKNRNGDRFCCLHCRRTGPADQIAAINLLARASDPEISRWMAFTKVKAVLAERFKKRQEEAAEGKAASKLPMEPEPRLLLARL
jgi:transposase